ncbi:MAG: TolC family protein, partial [Muribaculaceae bacterium]|nr:TolC family protein [Muribaculaceae bacterium]
MKSLIIRSVACASMLCGASATLSAQSPFQSAVDCIVAHSPKVQAAAKSATSERLELQMSNRLADPELEGAYQWGQGGVGDKWEAGVSQSFDWPGVYAARSRANGRKSEALQWLVEATANDVRMEAATALIDYVWANQQTHITESVLQQMQTLESAYDKAFQHGEATILDVNKTRLTRIDASRAHTAALSYLNAVRSSVCGMAPMLNVDSLLATVNDYPAQKLYSLEQYQGAVSGHDPMIRSLSLSADAAMANVSVARRSQMPGFKVGYSHLCELGDHFNGISFGLNLPVFSARNKVAAAQAAAEAAELELTQNRVSLMSRTAALYAEAKALAEEIGRYGAVATDPRPMQLLKQALDGGEINLLTYLQEVAYFNEAAISYLELQKQYHTVVAT